MTNSKKNKELNKSEVPARLLDDGTGKKLKEIPRERKFVRRPKKAFEAGAEPSRGGNSYRMVGINVQVIPELKIALKALAEKHNVDLVDLIRGIARKSLREGEQLDLEYELSEPVNVEHLGISFDDPDGPE